MRLTEQNTLQCCATPRSSICARAISPSLRNRLLAEPIHDWGPGCAAGAVGPKNRPTVTGVVHKVMREKLAHSSLEGTASMAGVALDWRALKSRFIFSTR